MQLEIVCVYAFADKPNTENKKIRVLKLLAIKAACFLKWNLSDLEKRLVLLHFLQLSCCVLSFNYSDI